MKVSECNACMDYSWLLNLFKRAHYRPWSIYILLDWLWLEFDAEGWSWQTPELNHAKDRELPYMYATSPSGGVCKALFTFTPEPSFQPLFPKPWCRRPKNDSTPAALFKSQSSPVEFGSLHQSVCVTITDERPAIETGEAFGVILLLPCDLWEKTKCNVRRIKPSPAPRKQHKVWDSCGKSGKIW